MKSDFIQSSIIWMSSTLTIWYLAELILSVFHNELDAILGPENQIGNQNWLIARRWQQLEASQSFRYCALHLEHGKLLSNALDIIPTTISCESVENREEE